MRHFKFYSDSPLYLSIAKSLVKQKGVTYTFKPDGDKENMGFKIGEYDIFVDDSLYNNESALNLLKDYEILEINRKDYEESLNLREKHSYEELLQTYNEYHKLVEEQEKYVEECLAEQRKRIFKNVLKEYEKDIESEVEIRVAESIKDFRNRFANDECSHKDISQLYKKYIDAEIKMNLEGFVKRYFTNKEMGMSIINRYFKEFREIYGSDEVEKDIKRFKNDLVDSFMKVSGIRRGQKDYMLSFKRAGKLADLIENKLWSYYALSKQELVNN